MRPLGAFDQRPGIGQNLLEQAAPGAGELVGDLGGEALGEDLAVLPLLDVRPAALHEMAGELLAQGLAAAGGGVLQFTERRVQQAE